MRSPCPPHSRLHEIKPQRRSHHIVLPTNLKRNLIVFLTIQCAQLQQLLLSQGSWNVDDVDIIAQLRLQSALRVCPLGTTKKSLSTTHTNGVTRLAEAGY
jgi:hypothetical protein